MYVVSTCKLRSYVIWVLSLTQEFDAYSSNRKRKLTLALEHIVGCRRTECCGVPQQLIADRRKSVLLGRRLLVRNRCASVGARSRHDGWHVSRSNGESWSRNDSCSSPNSAKTTNEAMVRLHWQAVLGSDDWRQRRCKNSLHRWELLFTLCSRSGKKKPRANDIHN